jgi:hypothetical protein
VRQSVWQGQQQRAEQRATGHCSRLGCDEILLMGGWVASLLLHLAGCVCFERHVCSVCACVSVIVCVCCGRAWPAEAQPALGHVLPQ